MGLFRRKREPFLTASPDAPVPGMSATSVVPAETGGSRLPAVDAPVVEPFTLAVEDVFTITGRGTVVTGTVATGTVRRGDAVEVVRDGVTVVTTVVGGVESLRKQTDMASAGATVGLLLRGVARDQVARDDVIRAAS